MTVIGESVLRLEDRALLTGTGRFAGDQNFEDQLHMRVVRATVAHGRILSITTEDAAAMPGVFADLDRGRYCRRTADQSPPRQCTAGP